MQGKQSDSESKDLKCQRSKPQKKSQFIKFNSHYQEAKKNFLEVNKRSYAYSLGKFEIEGYKDKHIRHFIQQISVNDLNYKLQVNEFNEIINELISLFRKLKEKIILQASQEDSEYQRILGDNSIIFKESRRQKRFQAYTTIERIVSLDLFGLISKRNFEYDSYEHGFRLFYFIPHQTIENICGIPQSNGVYRFAKLIWEQYYHFIGQTHEISNFHPLVDLLLLVHLKRKETFSFKGTISKCSYLKSEELIKRFKRPNRNSFINQEEFQFKFCEVVILHLKFEQIQISRPNEQIVLKRKMEKIFDQQKRTRQHLQLRKLLFQSGLSFRSVVEWWNYMLSKDERQPSQKQIIQALHHYNWQFLEQRAIYNNAFSLQPKTTSPNIKMYIDEYISDTIFCKLALERTMKVTNFMAIQNSIMTEADQQEPLYIRHFTYLYSQCQQKSQENVQQKGKSMRSEAVYTLFLGVASNRIIFFADLKERLNQNTLVQLLTSIIDKYHKRYSLKTFLQEFRFSFPGFQEQLIRRILQFFKKKIKSPLAIDNRPTSYFLHFVVNNYIEKYLRASKFESEDEFSSAIKSQSQRIIRHVNNLPIINHIILNKIMMIK